MLEYFVAKVHFNIISLMSTTWVSHIKCCDEHKIDVTVNFQVFEVEDLGIAMDYGLQCGFQPPSTITIENFSTRQVDIFKDIKGLSLHAKTKLSCIIGNLFTPEKNQQFSYY